MLAAMQHDKKTEAGRLRFVLPTKLGTVETVEGIDPTEVGRRCWIDAPRMSLRRQDCRWDWQASCFSFSDQSAT